MKTRVLQLIVAFLIIWSGCVNAIAQKYSSASLKQMSDTVNVITRNCNSEYDKAHAIYSWITRNIEYDDNLVEGMADDAVTLFLTGNEYDLMRYIMEVKQFNQKQMTQGVKVFEERKGICSSISHLYQLMCAFAGIKCRSVVGVGKTDLGIMRIFNINSMVGGHAWNVAIVDGREILVDATWGIQDDRYFDVDPEKMIYTHFPMKKADRLTNANVSIWKFAQLPFIGSDEWNEHHLKSDLAKLGKPTEWQRAQKVMVELIFDINK